MVPSYRAYRGRALPGCSSGLGSCTLSSFHWISALLSHKTGGMGRSLAEQERQQRLLQQSWGREKKILVLSVTLTRGLGCLVSFGDAKEAGPELTLWALRLLQPGLATSGGNKISRLHCVPSGCCQEGLHGGRQESWECLYRQERAEAAL